MMMIIMVMTQVAAHYLMQYIQQPSQGGSPQSSRGGLVMSLWADLIECAMTAPAEMSEADMGEQLSLSR